MGLVECTLCGLLVFYKLLPVSSVLFGLGVQASFLLAHSLQGCGQPWDVTPASNLLSWDMLRQRLLHVLLKRLPVIFELSSLVRGCEVRGEFLSVLLHCVPVRFAPEGDGVFWSFIGVDFAGHCGSRVRFCHSYAR